MYIGEELCEQMVGPSDILCMKCMYDFLQNYR